MTVDLGPIVDMVGQLWLGAFAVFLRVGAVVFLAPGFGDRAVPVRVRLILAFAYTAIVAPLTEPVGGGGLLGVAAAEVTAGLLLGIALRSMIFALQTAGAIAAQSTSLAQMFGGVDGEPAAAYGHLLTMAGVAVALAMGLPVRLAEFLIGSYQLLPAGEPIAGAALAETALDLLSGAFALGFQLAIPFVVAAFLYNLTLGLMNRAMPQLMVVFVGAPALTFGGLVLMMVATPLLIETWTMGLGDILAGKLGGR